MPHLFPVDNGMVNEGLLKCYTKAFLLQHTWSYITALLAMWKGREGKGKEVLPVAWLTVTSSCWVY